MTNEKDRYWRNKGCGWVDKDHRCEQWCQIERIPAAAQERIRAEAVKAERERCADRTISLIDNGWIACSGASKGVVRAFILSDDQEAEVIEMPGEAPPVVAFPRFEKRSGVTTEVDDQEAPDAKR